MLEKRVEPNISSEVKKEIIEKTSLYKYNFYYSIILHYSVFNIFYELKYDGSPFVNVKLAYFPLPPLLVMQKSPSLILLNVASDIFTNRGGKYI